MSSTGNSLVLSHIFCTKSTSCQMVVPFYFNFFHLVGECKIIWTVNLSLKNADILQYFEEMILKLYALVQMKLVSSERALQLAFAFPRLSTYISWFKSYSESQNGKNRQKRSQTSKQISRKDNCMSNGCPILCHLFPTHG